MKKLVILTLAIALVLPLNAFAGSGYTKKTAGASMDVVDMAAHAGVFNTLVQAIQSADLEPVLRGEGPFTVFAPTDEAFAKLPAGTIEDLLKPENQEKLQAILTYHVVPGEVYAKDVVKMESGKTANGQDVRIRTENGSVFIDDAKVTKADVPASNGVIHIIDTVLMPQ